MSRWDDPEHDARVDERRQTEYVKMSMGMSWQLRQRAYIKGKYDNLIFETHGSLESLLEALRKYQQKKSFAMRYFPFEVICFEGEDCTYSHIFSNWKSAIESLSKNA